MLSRTECFPVMKAARDLLHLGAAPDEWPEDFWSGLAIILMENMRREINRAAERRQKVKGEE